MAGRVAVGRRLSQVRIPTLVGDGTEDALDPSVNDHSLADSVRGAKLLLYPGGGHAFLFQDSGRFLAAVENFLR